MKLLRKAGLIGRWICYAAAFFATGCSSFNREWKAELANPTPTTGIVGPWEGTWRSDANGHNGRLRCIITETGTNEYSAQFRANYKRVLGFGYTAPLKGEDRDGAVHFTGQADLGKLAGGVYTYRGTASPTNFFSTYESSRDHGKFEMKRPTKE